jgi:hypothetical protein
MGSLISLICMYFRTNECLRDNHSCHEEHENHHKPTYDHHPSLNDHGNGEIKNIVYIGNSPLDQLKLEKIN